MTPFAMADMHENIADETLENIPGADLVNGEAEDRLNDAGESAEEAVNDATSAGINIGEGVGDLLEGDFQGAGDNIIEAGSDIASAGTGAVGSISEAAGVSGAIEDVSGFLGIDPPCCNGCFLIADTPACNAAPDVLDVAHDDGRTALVDYIEEVGDGEEEWLDDNIQDSGIFANFFQRYAEQVSAVAMHQMFAIGAFFDAKQQLETQRNFQVLQLEAHRDYQPSEDFCWFGTNARSLAHSEQISRHNALAMRPLQMSRHLGTVNMGGASNEDFDRYSRWARFTANYCDPADKNWVESRLLTGMTVACWMSTRGETQNIDVDYARLIDQPRTIDVAFQDFASSSPPSASRNFDILAMSSNLYGHQVINRSGLGKEALSKKEAQHWYLALRSVAAKRSVAENSFNAIVGLKASGSTDARDPNSPETWQFLGAVLVELGVPSEEIYNILGEKPSYYAQLEVLAKKLYQNPDFYANLYDKPANVERKSVALRAIETMVDRAIYESQLRQEMATSVLLSSKLRPRFKKTSKDLAGGQ